MSAVCMACTTKSTVAWDSKSLQLLCSNCGDAGAYLVNPFSQGSNLVDRVMLDAWRSGLSDTKKKDKLKTIIDSYRDRQLQRRSV